MLAFVFQTLVPPKNSLLSNKKQFIFLLRQTILFYIFCGLALIELHRLPYSF